jgi:hypothetical protein
MSKVRKGSRVRSEKNRYDGLGLERKEDYREWIVK